MEQAQNALKYANEYMCKTFFVEYQPRCTIFLPQDMQPLLHMDRKENKS